MILSTSPPQGGTNSSVQFQPPNKLQPLLGSVHWCQWTTSRCHVQSYSCQPAPPQPNSWFRAAQCLFPEVLCTGPGQSLSVWCLTVVAEEVQCGCVVGKSECETMCSHVYIMKIVLELNLSLGASCSQCELGWLPVTHPHYLWSVL